MVNKSDRYEVDGCREANLQHSNGLGFTSYHMYGDESDTFVLSINGRGIIMSRDLLTSFVRDARWVLAQPTRVEK